MASGLVLRLVGQPLLPGMALRPILLASSGAMELIGVLLAVHAFALMIGHSIQPPPVGKRCC